MDEKPTLFKVMLAKRYVLHAVFRMFLYLQPLAEQNMSMVVWSAQFQSKQPSDMGADIVIAVDISARPDGSKARQYVGFTRSNP